MKVYLDTEFIEGFRRPYFNLFGKKRHFIDLVSIALVTDTGKEYYAICKDFNFNDADDWVRQHVLHPIFWEMFEECQDRIEELDFDGFWSKPDLFCAHNFHVLLDEVGKSREQIAREITAFINESKDTTEDPLLFYAYYADYDWVVFASLFGKMIDLPSGFPMFCMDLKQSMVEAGLDNKWKRQFCPEPINEHHALVDAKWNLQLHDAIEDCKTLDLSFEELPLSSLLMGDAKIIPHPATPTEPQQHQETYPTHGDQTIRLSGGKSDSDGTLLHPPVA